MSVTGSYTEDDSVISPISFFESSFLNYCSNLTKRETLDNFVTDENGRSLIFLDIQILPSGTFQGRPFANRRLIKGND